MTLKRFSSIVGFICAAATLLFLLAPAAQASDGWAQWRGPGQQGVADSGGLPEGGFRLETKWQRDFGSAYSSVSADGTLLVTGSSNDTQDQVVAVHADTGKTIWSFDLGPVYKGHDGSDNGPLSTPAISADSVFMLSSYGRLVALDRKDGTLRWSVDLKKSYEDKQPYFGYSSSPLYRDGTLYVAASGPKAGLIAFNAKNGKEKWKSASLSVDYESPLWTEAAGKEQIVLSGKKQTVGIDPRNGSFLWSIELESSGSGTPVELASGRYLIAGNGESYAVQVSGTDKGLKAEVAWSTSSFKGNSASPVLIDAHLYGFDGRFMTCVSAADGSRVWKSRPPGGNGLIAVDNYLVALDSAGGVSTVRADPSGFVAGPQAEFAGESGYTAPSFSNGAILVRNAKKLGAFRIVPEPTEGVAP